MNPGQLTLVPAGPSCSSRPRLPEGPSECRPLIHFSTSWLPWPQVAPNAQGFSQAPMNPGSCISQHQPASMALHVSCGPRLLAKPNVRMTTMDHESRLSNHPSNGLSKDSGWVCSRHHQTVYPASLQGMTGKGFRLPRSACKDWKRCLLLRIHRHQHKARRIMNNQEKMIP